MNRLHRYTDSKKLVAAGFLSRELNEQYAIPIRDWALVGFDLEKCPFDEKAVTAPISPLRDVEGDTLVRYLLALLIDSAETDVVVCGSHLDPRWWTEKQKPAREPKRGSSLVMRALWDFVVEGEGEPLVRVCVKDDPQDLTCALWRHLALAPSFRTPSSSDLLPREFYNDDLQSRLNRTHAYLPKDVLFVVVDGVRCAVFCHDKASFHFGGVPHGVQTAFTKLKLRPL